MSVSVVIGVGVVVALLMLFTAMVDRKKHEVIRNFFMIISIPLLFIIPASLVLEQQVCEVVKVNESTFYSYGNNFSYANGSPTYHWDYGDAPQFNPAVQNTPDSVFRFHEEKTIGYDTFCYDKQNASRAFILAFTTIIVVFMIYIGIRFAADVFNWLLKIIKKN